MKILQLGKHYPFHYGGIEKFYFDLAKELNKQNIECDIFCANESKVNKIFSEDGVKIISYGRFAFKASTSLSYKVFSELKKVINQYDVLHVHLPDPMIVVALFVLRPKQPIILHWHSDIVKQKISKKLFLPFQNWILNRANKIIATSPNYIESSVDLQYIKSKCIAIPSGLNPNRLVVNDKRLEELKNKYKGKKIIYFFGRMAEYKGVEYLIQSVQYFSNHFHFIISGGGDIAQYKQMVKQMNIEDKVTFTGRIENEEVGAYYKLCDLFVLPSITRNEAFGLVQCEAMYFGKPVVSTNIEGSGVSYVNKNEETGLIVPIKEPKAIYDACKKIIENDELYRKFSSNAKLRFKKLFHIKSIANEITKVYKEVIKDDNKK